MTESPELDSSAWRTRFSVYIDYDRKATDASRVFRAMAAILDSIGELDRDLAVAIFGDLDVISELHGIEASSLRALAESAIRYVNGEPPTDENLAGAPSFVARTRERILRYFGAHSTVERREDIAELRRDIDQIAEETGISRLLTYAAPQPKVLLARMKDIGDAAAELAPTDRLEYDSDRMHLAVEERFTLDSDQIEELLTDRSVEDTITEELVVKKPDYLGNSMWQFRYKGRTVEAKISDTGWLERFQSRAVELHPGDAIRARIHAVVRIDKEGGVVSERYTVAKVLGVVRAGDAAQETLPFKGVA